MKAKIIERLEEEKVHVWKEDAYYNPLKITGNKEYEAKDIDKDREVFQIKIGNEWYEAYMMDFEIKI